MLRNITVRNLNLSVVHGDDFGGGLPRVVACAYAATLAESPIDGLYFENISISGRCGQGFRCSAFVGNDTSGNIMKLNAYGHEKNININGQDSIYYPDRCTFLDSEANAYV